MNRQAMDGAVTEGLLEEVTRRLRLPRDGERDLSKLETSEPQLALLMKGSLKAFARILKRQEAPPDGAEVLLSQLKLLSARMLGALRLADLRARRQAPAKRPAVGGSSSAGKTS